MLTLVLALAMSPQRIVVTAPAAHTTVASLSVYECGTRVLGPWRARVGRNGLSAHRHERDGTTLLRRLRPGASITVRIA